MTAYDVAIVGLGAMGSAAAWQLSRRGCRVLGLDRWRPPHALGSSHGETRIIREAYFEHPLYVPFVQRAYEGWAELEAASGERLLERTGGVMIGVPEGALVTGALASAAAHGLPHDVLTAADVRARFPALHPDAGMVGVWEPRAAMLFPERCIEACLRLAGGRGATLRFDDPVRTWTPEGSGVALTTAGGRYTAGALVIAAGPWVGALMPDSGVPFRVVRNVAHWFEPRDHAGRFARGQLPVYLLESRPDVVLYGFPAHGTGVKIARHHFGAAVDPDRVDRHVSPDEVAGIRPLLERYLPDLNGRWLASAVCLYTNTPDGDFVIDWHPQTSRVLVVSPCSGHGFKFACTVGEIVADLVLDGATRFDLTPFRLSRFGAT